MFSKWFVIEDRDLWDEDYLNGTPWSSGGNRWGRKLGGHWCLDYWFKIMFDLSNEDWENKCSNLRTDQDFYDLCEWLGIYYMKDGIIYRKEQKYNKKGNKL